VKKQERKTCSVLSWASEYYQDPNQKTKSRNWNKEGEGETEPGRRRQRRPSRKW